MAAPYVLPAATIVGNANLGSFADLRNGVIAGIRAPARRGAIAAEYHWAPVGNCTGMAAARSFNAYIASAYAVLGQHRSAATYVAAVDAATSQTHVVAVAAVPNIRRDAILLGSTRAGMASAWSIDDADISPDELHGTQYFRFDWPDGVHDEAHAAAGAIAFTSGHNQAAATVNELVAGAFAALNAVEADLAYVAFRLGTAALPLVGLTLMQTGHHYLTSSNKAFLAVERQVVVADAVKAIWDAAPDVCRDLVWHKAGHPILSLTSMGFCMRDDSAERLKKVGLGSAAVRLPYMEDQMKAAKAYLALHRTVQAVYANTDWKIEFPNLQFAIGVVERFVPTAADVMDSKDAPGIFNRTQAIERFLAPAMERAEPAVAFVAGLYRGLADDTDLQLARDTLWQAKSIKRIVAGNVGSVAIGNQAYQTIRRMTRLNVEAGKPTRYVFTA